MGVMKAMIFRRNARARGIDVGWRYGDGADARAVFWATARDVAALRALITDVRRLGEAFAPPCAAAIDAAAAGDLRGLARCVLDGAIAAPDALGLLEAIPDARRTPGAAPTDAATIRLGAGRTRPVTADAPGLLAGISPSALGAPA
jgi:hypothetical protein